MIPRIRSGIVALAILAPGVLLSKPTVRLFHPPPGMYGLERLWRVEVRNPDAQSYKVRLRGQVTEAEKGVVFTAETKEFEIAAHQTKVLRYGSPDLQMAPGYPTYAKGYEQFAARTGGLPPGDYTFRVWLLPDFGEGMVRFRSEPAGPPRLISPRNGAELQQEPLFTWMPPRPKPSGAVSYRLKLVEVLPGQSVEEALRGNPAWFEKKGIRGTSFRYPVSGRAIQKGKKYAWQVTAEASGIQPLVSEEWGFSRFAYRPGLQVLNPLKVEREVTRHANYFSVRLILTNLGSVNLTNIVLTDSHRYFQCLDDASKSKVQPPGGEQIQGWQPSTGPAACAVRSTGGGFYGIIVVDLGDWVLPPGLSFSVRYSVFPLLTFSLQGPGHTIGSGLKVTYRVGQNDWVRSFGNRAVHPVPGLADAWKAADYMILTSPSRVQGSQAAVDDLLVKTAELAKLRSGAICYLTSAPLTATSVRTIIKAFGGLLKNNWQNGYLLILGEDDVIPTWSKPAVASPDIPAVNLSDFDYADPNDDLLPDRRVGRMLGRNAGELRASVQHALDYKKGGTGWSSHKPVAIFISGPEPGKWLFVKDMATGADTMADVWGNNTGELHTDYITTRYRIVRHALYALRESGGVMYADTSDTLGNYSYDQLAAWLLDLKMVAPMISKLRQLYPPQSGDTQFRDVNGVWRRLPAGFGTLGFTEAVQLAEQTMRAARDGHTYAAYQYFPPDASHDPPAMIFTSLDWGTVAKDLIVWVGHSGSNVWGDVVAGWNVKNLHIARHPVIIAFGCHCGNYDNDNAVSREFLTRFASVYIGATANMYGFGDHMLATEWWHAWSPGMSIGEGLQRLKLWNVQAAPQHGSDKILGVPWITYFVRIMNLYGDPKVGGM